MGLAVCVPDQENMTFVVLDDDGAALGWRVKGAPPKTQNALSAAKHNSMQWRWNVQQN